MNRYPANDHGDLTRTSPLFASSWLALFDLLYGYLYQRNTDDTEEHRDKPKTH